MSSPSPVPGPPRPPAGGPTEPPADRGPDLDELVRGLDDLDERPLAEHHDRLTEVHEALHAALHQPPAG